LGALHALDASGQIDKDTSAVWHKRFHGQLASLRTPPESAQSPLESPAAIDIPTDEPSVDDFDESTFVGAIAGPDRNIQTEAGRLRITGIEMYERGLLVHWLLRLVPHLEAFAETSRASFPSVADRQEADQMLFRAVPHFKVKDTLGTQYIEAQSLWVGTGTLHGDARFLPGVPPLASGLEFQGAGWQVKLELPPRKAY
jgi:hypothetical protein